MMRKLAEKELGMLMRKLAEKELGIALQQALVWKAVQIEAVQIH